MHDQASEHPSHRRYYALGIVAIVLGIAVLVYVRGNPSQLVPLPLEQDESLSSTATSPQPNVSESGLAIQETSQQRPASERAIAVSALGKPDAPATGEVMTQYEAYERGELVESDDILKLAEDVSRCMYSVRTRVELERTLRAADRNLDRGRASQESHQRWVDGRTEAFEKCRGVKRSMRDTLFLDVESMAEENVAGAASRYAMMAAGLMFGPGSLSDPERMIRIARRVPELLESAALRDDDRALYTLGRAHIEGLLYERDELTGHAYWEAWSEVTGNDLSNGWVGSQRLRLSDEELLEVRELAEVILDECCR